MLASGQGAGTTADAGAAVGAPLPWLVVGGLLLAALAVCSVRSVPIGERLVVFRLGGHGRVRGPGLAFVLPGVERAVQVSLHTRWIDARTEAATRDAVTVSVSATAFGSVHDPARYALASAAPIADTACAVECALREYIATRDLLDLGDAHNLQHAGLPARISERTGEWGVAVTDVDLGPVLVRLDGDMKRWATDRAPGR